MPSISRVLRSRTPFARLAKLIRPESAQRYACTAVTRSSQQPHVGTTSTVIANRRAAWKSPISVRFAQLSTSPAGGASAEPTPDPEPVETLVYEGPFSRVVRMIKYVSITSSTLAIGFIPLSTYIGDSSVPNSAKLAISSTVALFAISTTGVLHWFTARYIRSIKCTEKHAQMLGFSDGDSSTDYDDIEPEVDESGQLKPIPLQIETFNFFAQPKRLTCMSDELNFHVTQVTPTSFAIRDRSFWMHEELVEADWRLHLLFAPLVR